MIWLFLYVLSIFLAPVLGGLLDRKYETTYPAGNLGFVLISPISCVIILIAYVCCFIANLNFDYENIKITKKIYNFIKGTK
jgi:hypothetical protein